MQGCLVDWGRRGFYFLFLLLGTGCIVCGILFQKNMVSHLQARLLHKLMLSGWGINDTLHLLDYQGRFNGDWWIPKGVLLAYEEELQKTADQKEQSTNGEQFKKNALPGKKSQADQKTLSTSLSIASNQGMLRAMQEENQKLLQQERSRRTEELIRETDNENKIEYLTNTLSLSYLLKKFYIVDRSTSIDKNIFNVDALLHTGCEMKKQNKPQILIFHTHGASEHFIDSDPQKISDSVVGVGVCLAELLEKKYGYQVIHDETRYDMIHGKIDRNKAYNKAYEGLKATLKKYPSIQVVIDLHRDGVGNEVHRIAKVHGKKTAQLMFFNGLSRNRRGAIKYLKNENLQANLAFSLQLKLACMKRYPGLARPVYLKSYRYNLHLRRRSLLIELGNENNTVQEAKNAMEPLADVLNEVLSGR